MARYPLKPEVEEKVPEPAMAPTLPTPPSWPAENLPMTDELIASDTRGGFAWNFM